MAEWPENLLRILDHASVVLLATRDAQLHPHSGRGFRASRGTQRDHLVVWAVPSQSVQVIDDLRDNGAVAVLISVPMTHETFQLKGRMVSIEDAPASDEPMVRARLEMLCQDGERMGVSRRMVERLEIWPAQLITIAVEQIFRQTPGPGAGDRVMG